MKTRTVLFLIILVLLAGAGYYAFSRAAQPGEPLLSQPSTAVVRQSDLLVRLSGSGELVAAEFPLAFGLPGVVSEINVKVGDSLQAGEILARLDTRQAALDLKTAQLNWEALTAPHVLVNAEQDRLEYQQALAEAQAWLDFVRQGLPVSYYEALLDQAMTEHLEIEADLSIARAQNDRRAVTQLKRQLNQAQVALEEAQTNLEWAQYYQPNPHDLALAEAQASLAAARLAAQEVYLDVLQGAPLPAAEAVLDRNEALLALERAKLAFEKAQWTLAHMVLSAPTAGTVTQVFVAPGERVAGDPVLTLSLLDSPQVRFYLEEADLAQVSPGDRLEIRLDAYPDQVFQGSLVRIDPALVSVDGSMLVQGWGKFTSQPEVALFPGMSLEVDVIAAEAMDALLVPRQALRQNAAGDYFVEVHQPDGTFTSTSVVVGLKDLANAQILSGLQVGDQVSTAVR